MEVAAGAVLNYCGRKENSHECLSKLVLVNVAKYFIKNRISLRGEGKLSYFGAHKKGAQIQVGTYDTKTNRPYKLRISIFGFRHVLLCT